MTTLASRTIAALRAEHDNLVSAASALSPAQLAGPSGAADWTVAQVLSHLGSGAEISLAGFRASMGQAAAPAPDFNQGVWDRWNAMSPPEQAAGAVQADATLVAALEALTPAQHDEVKVKLGFLPQPITFTAYAGMRLNETVQHGWDVRAGIDPGATLADASAQVLADHFADDLSFLLGFIGKPDAMREPAVIEISETPFSIVVDDRVQFTTDAPSPTATFTGRLESAMRLIAGRLTPQHTPSGTLVTGNISLDELRSVFPGY